VASRPLRLKILILLCVLDVILTFSGNINYARSIIETIPHPYSNWLMLLYLTFYFAIFLLLALLWVRNKMAYTLALIFFAFEVAWYFIAYPTYPTIFLILESTQLALLLSLFTYFFQKP